MARPNASFLESRRLLGLALLAALGWSIWQVQWGQPIIHGGGLGAAADLLRALFSPELSPTFLSTVLKASWHTVAYAFGGITLAVASGFTLGVVASGSAGQDCPRPLVYGGLHPRTAGHDEGHT